MFERQPAPCLSTITSAAGYHLPMLPRESRQSATTAAQSAFTACPQCDALHRAPPLRPGQSLCCTRCGALLARLPAGGVQGALAAHVTALILLLLSNMFPLIELDIQGRPETTTLAGAALAFYRADMPELAVVVLTTTVLAPGALLLSSLYVLAAVWFHRALPVVRRTLAVLTHLRPWCMLDVFLVSALIAFVKLRDIADLFPGPALYLFVAFMLAHAIATSTFEPQMLWQRLAPLSGAA